MCVTCVKRGKPDIIYDLIHHMDFYQYKVTMVVAHLGWIDLRSSRGLWAATAPTYCPTGGCNIPNQVATTIVTL